MMSSSVGGWGISVGGIATAMGILGLTVADHRTTSRLSVADYPKQNMTDSKVQLSDMEQLKKNSVLSKLETVAPDYTVTQLECSEKLGVHPSECNKDGVLIEPVKDSRGIQKRSVTEAQQECIDRLGVEPDACNEQGVYIDRNRVVMKEITRLLDYAEPETWTRDDMLSITILLLSYDQNLRINENDLDQLTNVQVLEAKYNSLTQFPQGLKRLYILEKLDLKDNLLSSIDPDIGSLSRLRRLSLSFNQIRELPVEMRALVDLRNFYISNNLLTTFPPEIANMTGLERLDLTLNRIHSFPSEIKGFPKLKYLGLADNQLTEFPDAIVNSPNLQTVIVQDNPMTLSKETFNGLLALQNPPTLYFKDREPREYRLRPNYEPTVLLDGHQVPLSEVVYPFFGYTLYGGVQFIDLSAITRQDLLNISRVNLTMNQTLFMDTYLQSVQDRPKELPTTLIDIDNDVVESNNNGGNQGIIAGVLTPLILVMVAIGTTAGTLVFLKRRYPEKMKIGNLAEKIKIGNLDVINKFNTCASKVKHYLPSGRHSNQRDLNRVASRYRQEDVVLKEIVVEPNHDLEAIIEQVHSGGLEGEDLIRLKDKETGLSPLHQLALQNPSILEKWVDEDRIHIERDLGNETPQHMDNSGNSVLHILASTTPEIIERWFNKGLVSTSTLSCIKNNNKFSVLDCMKSISPEMSISFQNTSASD